MGCQNSWKALKEARLKETVLWAHKTNLARWKWKQGMTKGEHNDLVAYVHRINIEYSEGGSGWDDMIPDNGSHNPQRVNGYIAIPERLLKKLGLLVEASKTYFTDWGPT